MKSNEIIGVPRGSFFTTPLYHGSHDPNIRKFNRPPHGVFFTPHVGWADEYGPYVYECYVWAPKVYVVRGSTDFDEELLDSLFDREYKALAACITKLQAKGYYALQTQTDSEMVCVFSNAKIYTSGQLV